MVILIALVFLWTPYAVWKVLRARDAGTPSPVQQQPAGARSLGGVQPWTITDDGPVWTALDDRQLTRLLTDSAPGSATELGQRP